MTPPKINNAFLLLAADYWLTAKLVAGKKRLLN
jgi:hypothetical protein